MQTQYVTSQICSIDCQEDCIKHTNLISCILQMLTEIIKCADVAQNHELSHAQQNPELISE